MKERRNKLTRCPACYRVHYTSKAGEQCCMWLGHYTFGNTHNPPPRCAVILKWQHNPELTLAELYRDRINNFLTLGAFAAYYEITEALAERVIRFGKRKHHQQLPQDHPERIP